MRDTHESHSCGLLREHEGTCTEAMLRAARADALAEDAQAVWESMIEAYEDSLGQKREFGLIRFNSRARPWNRPSLRIGDSHSTMTNDERMQRESSPPRCPVA
jgi:hypothetical protein